MAHHARSHQNVLLCAAALVALALGLQVHPASQVSAQDSAAAPARGPRPIDPEATATIDQMSRAFTQIAEAVEPSVVHIRSQTRNRALEELIRRRNEDITDEDLARFRITGVGSGIIFDEAGHIVTNHHVVEDAFEITVTLYDGRECDAKVIGTDSMTDLAVIQIQAEGLTPARLGDSDRVKVGQFILAFGSPFKLGHSVTHGIISAIGRNEVNVDVDYKNWLQTDAPINPGNSGGPWVNSRGEVIGLSIAIATESGGYQGVGFAVPSNNVRRICETLKTGRKIVRGYLGVVIQDVTPRIADELGLSLDSGVLIRDVMPEAPADQGGLRPDDIVVRVNAQPVRTRDQLSDLIAYTEPGSKLEMIVWRNGIEHTLTVPIGQQPPGFSTDPRAVDRSNVEPKREPDRE